jgi:hypothetical protein
MQSVTQEIVSAAKRLHLDPLEVVLLPAEDSERIYGAALQRFVGTKDRRWWWEAFREPGVSLAFVAGIVPNPSEPIWFIAEDDELPQYPVFEMSAEVAAKIIGECHGFEYYLVAKDLSWLVCETHLNVVCAVGAAVEGRLLEHGIQPFAPADSFAAR